MIMISLLHVLSHKMIFAVLDVWSDLTSDTKFYTVKLFYIYLSDRPEIQLAAYECINNIERHKMNNTVNSIFHFYQQNAQ